MDIEYNPPEIRRLGSVADLTMTPPGKVGASHDGSAFVENFSCVGPGPSCETSGGGLP